MDRSRRGPEVWCAEHVVEVIAAPAGRRKSKRDHQASVGKHHYRFLCVSRINVSCGVDWMAESKPVVVIPGGPTLPFPVQTLTAYRMELWYNREMRAHAHTHAHLHT